MTGFEPLELEATALPTEPQPLPVTLKLALTILPIKQLTTVYLFSK